MLDLFCDYYFRRKNLIKVVWDIIHPNSEIISGVQLLETISNYLAHWKLWPPISPFRMHGDLEAFPRCNKIYRRKEERWKGERGNERTAKFESFGFVSLDQSRIAETSRDRDRRSRNVNRCLLPRTRGREPLVSGDEIELSRYNWPPGHESHNQFMCLYSSRRFGATSVP